jgi:EmrB/QacA subfamily drug resistance transporter
MKVTQSSKWSNLLVLLCVSVPSFMINLDSNIVAVSLTSISSSLHADFTAIEWVISAYTLTFAALVLPAGTLADRFGRKRVLLLGLLTFTIASLVCGAAPNATVLNIARAVQGVGAALQLSAALAILSFEFRGPARAKAFAFWGTVIGIAITMGPIAGGLITQELGWQWAFYLNLPVGVAMFVLTALFVTESRDPAAVNVDVLGVATFAASLVFLTIALISGNHEGWSSYKIVIELAAAVIFFAAFILVETRQERPMLDLSFFEKQTYIGANIAGLAYAVTLLTMLTYLPLLFQSELALTPQEAGLYMLPIAVPMFAVPRLVSKYLSHRVSGRTLITMGLTLSAIGLFLLSISAQQALYSALLPGMLVVGISAGFLNGETAKVAMSVIPPERAGMAAGVGGTIRFAGIVIGFAGLGAILFETVSNKFGEFLGRVLDSSQIFAVQGIVVGKGAPAEWNVPPNVATGIVGAGYSMVFLTASILALAASAATWALIKSADTMPHIHAPMGSEVLPIVD